LADVIHFFKNTVEWQGWGYNALTISFIATAVFTVLEGWGFWMQNLSIWRNKSGESISVVLFIYFGCLFISVIAYGYNIKSMAAIFNGMLGFLHLPILFGLWRYKGYTKLEIGCLCAFPAMIPAMIFLPWKDLLMISMLFGSIIPLAMQLYEMWRAKSAGVVDARFLGVLIISTAFWVVYAFAIQNWVMEVIYPLTLAILVLIFLLRFHYTRPSGYREKNISRKG
jgi:uncharacterized protein with PQ loop repeat